jgi:hypothetical protein
VTEQRHSRERHYHLVLKRLSAVRDWIAHYERLWDDRLQRGGRFCYNRSFCLCPSFVARQVLAASSVSNDKLGTKPICRDQAVMQMKKVRVYAGLALHAPVASVMIFSAIIKFLELIDGEPPEFSRKYVPLLAAGELANALLLLIPRTMSFGILITSAGWGAAIALCLVEASQIAPMHPLVPTAFLVMTWVGGYLRDSRMFYSFSPPEHNGPESNR